MNFYGNLELFDRILSSCVCFIIICKFFKNVEVSLLFLVLFFDHLVNENILCLFLFFICLFFGHLQVFQDYQVTCFLSSCVYSLVICNFFQECQTSSACFFFMCLFSFLCRFLKNVEFSLLISGFSFQSFS